MALSHTHIKRYNNNTRRTHRKPRTPIKKHVRKQMFCWNFPRVFFFFLVLFNRIHILSYPMFVMAQGIIYFWMLLIDIFSYFVRIKSINFVWLCWRRYKQFGHHLFWFIFPKVKNIFISKLGKRNILRIQTKMFVSIIFFFVFVTFSNKIFLEFVFLNSFDIITAATEEHNKQNSYHSYIMVSRGIIFIIIINYIIIERYNAQFCF